MFWSKCLDSVLVKVSGKCFGQNVWIVFWLQCLDGVFISVLVAHLHVKFCTINAPSRHCVFIGPFFFPYG